MCNIIKKQICFFPLSWGSTHITVCFQYMGWIIRIVDPSMSQDFLPKLFQKNTCRKKRFSHVVDSILLEFFVMFWKSYICQFELTFIYGINMCFKTRVMSCYLQWMLDVLRGFCCSWAHSSLHKPHVIVKFHGDQPLEIEFIL